MIIDFLTYNLKKKLAQEVERAESAETALKIESFASANYDASGKTIDFYNGYGDMIDSIDATDFIIDGMIEDVYLSGTDLCIIFNTDAGQQDITIDLTSFINPANYYTKDETDALIDAEEARALSAETLIAEEIDGLTTRVGQIEEVTSIALNELHDENATISGDVQTNATNIASISGICENFVTSADVASQVEAYSYATSADVLTVSGDVITLSGNVETALGNKYAPSTAGEAGQVVMSNGSGMPSWSSFKFWEGTQSQYDAIVTKDNKTVYFVKPD